MNNFKFRVWDKVLKVMSEIIRIDLLKNEITYFETDNCCYKEINVNFNNYVIMQSTGLFDKYGVEIYEGDIIDVGTRIPFLNKIQRDEETAYLKLVPLDKRWTESYFTNFEDKSRYEVVGNIYENKELLENE